MDWELYFTRMGKNWKEISLKARNMEFVHTIKRIILSVRVTGRMELSKGIQFVKNKVYLRE